MPAKVATLAGIFVFGADEVISQGNTSTNLVLCRPPEKAANEKILIFRREHGAKRAVKKYTVGCIFFLHRTKIAVF